MQHCLLKYDMPVREEEDECQKSNTADIPEATYCSSSDSILPDRTCHYIDPCRLNKEETVTQNLEDFFKPIHYKEMGTKWVKHVSAKQATPVEMKHLEQEVDRILKNRCGRKVPLCVIRQDVLEDLVQELLRQITIDCPEQGVLFKRILDHFNAEFNAYETLLRFSESFVGRKRITWKHWKDERTKKISELEEAKRILEYQTAELKHKVDQIEKRNQEMKSKRDAARMEEVKYYKKRGEHLKAQMDISVLPKK
ncbi:unnamed protein product [Calicophoron daubneyi]|uniref:Uncharacterized protein n=1 Tax=Calicophoron daubneyi TaxID=300641 RepID=A0AAV2TGQ1_CALDB